MNHYSNNENLTNSGYNICYEVHAAVILKNTYEGVHNEFNKRIIS